MATALDTAVLDEMFALIDAMNVPAGYRAEIIEGEIVLNPQRKAHSTIIRLFTRSLEDALGRDANILWDVRIDFPGALNGFAPDVALIAEGAGEDERGRHGYRDVQLVVEVVSASSRRDDYDAKLAVYAAAEVPTYVIVDPKTGFAHVHHAPKDGAYDGARAATYAFGTPFTLPGTDIAVDTAGWPRD
ncbi:Uma2 family endonuclease [Streptomyces hypolithicus]